MNRYVYLGSDDISFHFFKKIHNKQCLAIITLNDRIKGRGRKKQASPLALFAEKNNIRLIKTDNINNKNILNILKEINPDFLLVFSFGQILKREILNIPLIMPVNLHPSLLPKYRGAAPINRVIMDNRKQTGITFIKMNERMDAGPIIMQESMELKDNITSIELKQTIVEKASKMFKEFNWNDNISLIEQDENEATYAGIIKKYELYFNEDYDAIKTNAIINGLSEYGIKAKIKNIHIKIYESEFIENNSKNESGLLKIDSKDIIMFCKKGSIKIKKIQRAGKRIMNAYEFLNGIKLKSGDKVCAVYAEQ